MSGLDSSEMTEGKEVANESESEANQAPKPSAVSRSPFADWMELAGYTVLGGVCWLVTLGWLGGAWPPAQANIALAVCYLSSVIPLVWQSGWMKVESEDVSIFLTIGFRCFMIIGALGISSATKWTHHNSFGACLLGYYFPFLVLQSAFSLRRLSITTPPPG